MSEAAEKIERLAAELGLEMTVEFVPWSKSRNAAEKQPSFNYKVTLRKGGREVLTTDYMMGCAHSPSYKPDILFSRRDQPEHNEVIRWECEHGCRGQYRPSLHQVRLFVPRKEIRPGLAEVLYCLAGDADALDCASFEEWASNIGYEPDSRQAERIYRACLDTALKLRSAIGDDGLKRLREAGAEY